MKEMKKIENRDYLNLVESHFLSKSINNRIFCQKKKLTIEFQKEKNYGREWALANWSS
jgi:hypothetical protein